MPMYKCPQCGREDLELSHGDLEAINPETTGGLSHKGAEARCPHCGWVGSVADLKRLV